MPESSRDKTIEVMARALYEANHPAGSCWSAWDALHASERSCYLDLAEAALTAYESHLQASGMAVVAGWQPIESAPKDDEDDVLLNWKNGLGVTMARFVTGINAWVTSCGDKMPGFDTHFTHWMPLPEPPASPYGKAVVKEKDDE